MNDWSKQICLVKLSKIKEEILNREKHQSLIEALGKKVRTKTSRRENE